MGSLTSIYNWDYNPDRVIPSFDHSRSDTPVWLWRNLWRRMLPPGLVLFKFQMYPTLVYFWNSGAALRWVYFSWSMTAALLVLDLLTYFAPSTAAMLIGGMGLSELRMMALPIYMLFAAMAVVERCLWWKASGRLDELLVTCLDGSEVLPLLWVPPAAKIMGIYGAGFFVHVALVGNWSIALQSMSAWFSSSAPKTLILAIVEFLLALLLMRAATICALFGAVRSKTVSGITGQALYRAFQYILLSIVGASGYLLGMAFFAAVSLAFGVEAFQTVGVFLAGLASMCLLRQLTIDTLDDYHEFRGEWRKWLVK